MDRVLWDLGWLRLSIGFGFEKWALYVAVQDNPDLDHARWETNVKFGDDEFDVVYPDPLIIVEAKTVVNNPRQVVVFLEKISRHPKAIKYYFITNGFASSIYEECITLLQNAGVIVIIDASLKVPTKAEISRIPQP